MRHNGLMLTIAAALLLGLCTSSFGAEHVVQPGQTLWNIARLHGLTVEELCRINDIEDADLIRAGQVLTLKQNRSGFLVGERVNLRSGPGTDQPVMDCLARGTHLELLQREAEWVKVRLPDGREGWVFGSYFALRQAGLSSRHSRIADRIVANARRLLGVPYAWGGIGPAAYDCSGFTQAVFASVGIELPRTASEQFGVGRPVDRADIAYGDLLFFSTYAPGPSHSAIYLGGDSFIHASSAGGGVIVTGFTTYYRQRYLGARRLF